MQFIKKLLEEYEARKKGERGALYNLSDAQILALIDLLKSRRDRCEGRF